MTGSSQNIDLTRAAQTRPTTDATTSALGQDQPSGISAHRSYGGRIIDCSS